MSHYLSACDLKVDILWRAGEPTDGNSDFDTTALVYLNRVHRAICLGGSELDPAIQEDWWWLRKSPPGVLILQPEYSTGTVTVTNNNVNVTFTNAPTFDATGWFLRINTAEGDIFRVGNHDANGAAAALDSVYTGPNASGVTFRLFKLEYDIATDVLRLISPMRIYRAERRFEILGVEVLAMDRDYPLALVESGIPDRYAQVQEHTIRFNRSGRTTATDLVRVEYDYLYLPDDLINSTASIPAVPLHWRPVLSDWATFWLLLDKNDNRAEMAGKAATGGLRAMANENRHKIGGTGRGLLGAIQARQDQIIRERGPIRTESGMIIG